MPRIENQTKGPISLPFTPEKVEGTKSFARASDGTIIEIEAKTESTKVGGHIVVPASTRMEKGSVEITNAQLKALDPDALKTAQAGNLISLRA